MVQMVWDLTSIQLLFGTDIWDLTCIQLLFGTAIWNCWTVSFTTESHFDFLSTATWNCYLELLFGNFELNNGQRLLSRGPTVRQFISWKIC